MAENIKRVFADWQVCESCRFDELVIDEGVKLTAPDDMWLTLVAGGDVKAPLPGRYRDVSLVVTPKFKWLTYRFGQTELNSFRAGAVIKDGKYLPEYSVPQAFSGGYVGDGKAGGMHVYADDWDFNGFYITGKGEYTIDGLKMSLTGDGTDDFSGIGAGIAVSGDMKVTVNNAEIHNFGISRGAAFVGENSEVTFNDCFFTLDSGTYTAGELEKRLAGDGSRMMEPPWVMGIAGHGRTTNLAGMATANYNRCHIVSNSWGCLSVDGGCVTRMNVKDSVLELTGASGYGVFSIADDVAFNYKNYGLHGSYDVFDHSVVKGVTYPIIMSNGKSGGAFINGAEVYSRFGALIFRNDGGHLDINSGASFNTKLSTFIVKGANSYISCDNAKLNAGNGVILNLMDNDETGMGGGNFVVPRGVYDTRIEGRDLFEAVPTEDVFVMMSNMEVVGDFFNSTTNTFPNQVREKGLENVPDGDPHMDFGQVRGMGRDLQGVKNLDIRFVNAKVTGLVTSAHAEYPEGLELITKANYEDLSVISCEAIPVVNNGVIASFDKDCVWTVTGDCWLSRLILKDGAQLVGAGGRQVRLSVDGVDIPVSAGDYKGEIHIFLA